MERAKPKTTKSPAADITTSGGAVKPIDAAAGRIPFIALRNSSELLLPLHQ
jgi:hypothetical protein